MPEKTTRVFVFFILSIMLLNHSASSQDDNYPPVHKEYFHKPIFKNDQIRVLDVRASKGDTTSFHRHCNPILYITIQGTRVSLQAHSELWRTAELPTGWIGQDIYDRDSCFIHRFAIPDDGRLHIVAVEALEYSNQISPDFEPTYKAEGFSLIEIEPSYLAQLTKYAIPIILVGSECQNECVVKVVSSERLSKRILKRNKAYAVFFENSDLKISE